MLQSIRDRSQGLVVGIIVTLISLTFVLVGIQSYLGGGSKVVVAEVDGHDIYLTEFQQNLQRFRQRAQSLLGDSFNPLDWDRPEIKQRVIDELIDNRVTAEVARNAWFRVGDAQVARELQTIPVFKDDVGRFSRALYEQRTRLLGYSELVFEERMRDELMRSQLYAGIGGSEITTSADLVAIQRLLEQKRDIGYAIIPGSGYVNEVTFSEDDLSTYYNENSSRYREEEKVSLEYVEVSASSLASTIGVSEQELRERYLLEVDKYTLAEERDAEYILLPLSISASDLELQNATSEIMKISKRFKNGVAVEKILEAFMEEGDSEVQGSRTGLFGKGVMAQAFEDAVFSMNLGEFSDPIRTDFGLHIIKLVQIVPSGVKAFEEVRADVEEMLKATESQKLYFEVAEDFSTLVYENPQDLVTTSEALGLEVKNLDFLNRKALTVLFSEQAATAIFDTEVVTENMNSIPVELADGRLMAFRSTGYKPSRVPPIFEIRDLVEQDLTSIRLGELVEKKASVLIESINLGEPVSDVIAKEGLDWKNVIGAKRDSSDVNRAIISKAFSSVTSKSGVIYFSVPVGISDYAVVRVSNVVFPEKDELDATSGIALREQVGEEREANTWTTYVRDLRQDKKIQIYRERL